MECLESSKLTLTAKLPNGGSLGGALSTNGASKGTLSASRNFSGELKARARLCGVLSTKGHLDGKLSGIVRYVEVPGEGGELLPIKVRSGTQSDTFTPPEGYYGFGEVTVEGDEDLLPENIKEGVNILGVDGAFKGGELQDVTVISSAKSIKIKADEDAGFYGFGFVTIDPDPALTPRVLKVGTKAYGVKGEFGNFQALTPATITKNGTYPYTPDSGYDGFSKATFKVNVPTTTIENVVNAKLDVLPTIMPKHDRIDLSASTYGLDGWSHVSIYGSEDFHPENIRKDKTIFGITGTYEKTEVVELDIESNKEAYLTKFPFRVDHSSDKDAMYAATIYSGDDNFISENIKSGVYIFGKRGTYVGENIKTQYKAITPPYFPYSVYPDSPNNGLHEVEIIADPNFGAHNIRRGVKMFGVTGTYESKLQMGTIVPAAKGYYVYPNEDGALGFEYVYVEGDDFLRPENVRDGITIFDVTGTYKGDGSTSDYANFDEEKF